MKRECPRLTAEERAAGGSAPKRQAVERPAGQAGQQSLDEAKIANLRLQLQLAEAHQMLAKKQQ